MKIGFIGAGAMAEALVKGILEKNLLLAENIYLSDHKAERCEYLKKQYQVQAFVGADSFLDKVDVLFLAIKPQAAVKAMHEVKDKLPGQVVIISIIAGMTLGSLEAVFQTQPVIRVMPNTPVAVGEGMSAFALGKYAAEKETEIVEKLLSAVGKAILVKEEAMDAVTGLSGSGPGYAFVMIDALADAGVHAGLARKTAITLAAQTLLGAAKMVLETGQHPAVLRDQVTSPAGTTIAGVRVLEQKGVRAALIDAVAAATEKSKAMGKK